MAKLQEQVRESASKLQESLAVVQSAANLSLPPMCYEYWVKKAGLHHALAATEDLFTVREIAWKAVKEITSPDNIVRSNDTRDYQQKRAKAEKADTSPNKNKDNLVYYQKSEVEFLIARNLVLTAYVVTTWSIYDRIVNVCGRLAGVSKLSENPQHNPKACQDLLGKEDTLGFGAHRHLKEAYAWPLKVSYKVRNWLVHEGYEQGNIPLFEGHRIEDGFILHKDAKNHFEKYCGYEMENGKVKACCLGEKEECWQSKDLLIILEKYHTEIDVMLLSLLKWSVNSFVGQITAFAERDKDRFTQSLPARKT